MQTTAKVFAKRQHPSNETKNNTLTSYKIELKSFLADVQRGNYLMGVLMNSQDV